MGTTGRRYTEEFRWETFGLAYHEIAVAGRDGPQTREGP
jgi:hypothetical protein